MILLNCGNLWTQQYLSKVIELNEQYGKKVLVKSLFGSIAKLTPTARSADRIPYLEWAQIDNFVRRALQYDISIRYTLNTSCIGSLQDFDFTWRHKKLQEDIQELHNIGVHEWTITSPLLIGLIRGMFPQDFIEVSTIYEMTSPQEAAHLMRLGANAVNISTSINRKPSAISHITKTGIMVSVLANEACLFRCPWRRECYNLSSHDSMRSDELFGSYPFAHCNNYRIDNPVEWVKSRMILPSWMAVYQQEFGINWFKIAYRTHPYEVAIPILEYYMKQQDPPNLLDLWPTIAHLGHTGEPKNIHFIPTNTFTHAMLRCFFEAGEKCDGEICGQTCKMCYRMTEQIIKTSTNDK